jgi:hypothetical protein
MPSLRFDEHGDCLKGQLRLSPSGLYLLLLRRGDALKTAGA